MRTNYVSVSLSCDWPGCTERFYAKLDFDPKVDSVIDKARLAGWDAHIELQFESGPRVVDLCPQHVLAKDTNGINIPSDDAFRAIIRGVKDGLPLPTSEEDLRLAIAKSAWIMALKWTKRPR